MAVMAKTRVAFAGLSALLLLASFQANACRLVGGAKWPTLAELTDMSSLVFVARIGPTPPAAAASPSHADGGPPGQGHDVEGHDVVAASVQRVLRGHLPVAGVWLRQALNNCEGPFLDHDTDYLVFTTQPVESDAVLIPFKGSFPLDHSSLSVADLKQVEARLNQEASLTP
ncbi:hypothetical protein ACYX7E_16230 [Luteimonas sp. RIT-PG2_3]